jgi:hypothetical protein
MSYTAQDLITRSWFLSGIIARNLQVPTGDQIYDGLQMLNDLLNFKQIEIDLIPYWTYIELPLVPGQEFYFLPYVAAIESATFNIDVVRYPMDYVARRNYYGSSRVDNISTLPFSWNYNRALGGGNMALYFKPEAAYPLKMMVKLFLVDVTLQTDLTNVSQVVPYTFINSSNQGLDTSYIEYLRYALAQYMCSEYGILFNPESEKILTSYKRKLMYIGPPDLSNIKTSILTAGTGLNWGDVNLGKGWRPS